MKHKCDGCRYKSWHQEMMFASIGVCTRTTNLVEAVNNYNAEKCPYNQTNFDRIKAMSVEELAVFLADEIPHGDCYGCGKCHALTTPYRLNDVCQDAWLKYLESEITDKGR